MRINFFAWCFAYSLSSLITCIQQYNQSGGNPVYGPDSRASDSDYVEKVDSTYTYKGKNLRNPVYNGKHESYLEVKPLDDSTNFVKTESESVEWTVRVNASPIAAVTWFNPNGEGINITFDNITEDGLKNRVISNYTGNITTLSIRNLSIDDSGIYQMRAFTLNHRRTLRYNLIVNGIATIRMNQYYPYNTLVCDVSAYPLATISWYRESCSSENSSDCMIPEYRGKTFNEYKRVSIIQLKEDDDSKPFVCEATNSIGTVRKTRRFKFIKIRTYDEDAANSPGIILYLGLAIFAIIFGSIFVSLLAMVLIQENKHGNNVPKKNRLSTFDTRVIRQLNPRIDIEEQAHLLPYDSKMEFPQEKLYLGRMIGKGAFGLIKKAVADNIGESTSPSTVAVKTIQCNTNRLYVKLLASELKLLIYVGNHPNLVNLLGACTVDFDTKKEFSTIVEYCKYGNLRDFLLIHRNNFINQLKENDEMDFSITKNVKKHKLPNIIDMTQSKARKYNYPPDWRSYFKGDYRISNIKSITTNDLIRWSYQTTCGMEYLTGRKVLHSDLTARNLLLDENKMVKICNFGLAKNIYQKDDYREIKTILLPMKWMALESIKLRKFSTHSDVWSFGVTMWELFSLSEIPFPDINSLETLYEILTSGERLGKPPFASNELYSIMKDCWNPLETTRPSFEELGSKLSRILESNIRLSSTRNETREPKMTDLIQNIHLQDKINTSHQDILLQMASVNLSTSNSSDLNCSSIEMKPRNSRVEQNPEE